MRGKLLRNFWLFLPKNWGCTFTFCSVTLGFKNIFFSKICTRRKFEISSKIPIYEKDRSEMRLMNSCSFLFEPTGAVRSDEIGGCKTLMNHKKRQNSKWILFLCPQKIGGAPDLFLQNFSW